MSDAKPRKTNWTIQLPLSFTNLSVGNALTLYTEHTDGWQLVCYQCINTIYCHVFKVYVTKLPSTICTTVWVLKANTSKTEMKKRGRKIPLRNTILSHLQ
jgi:hypothetical protein